jgi:KDO2-lipid IV(A) lauroyltransferase
MITLVRLLSRLLTLLPYTALQRLGRALGWFMGRVLRHRRAQVLDTLARCFPDKTETERARIADGMYRHLATMTLECLRFADRQGGAFRDWVDIEGAEHAEAALARGRGALVLMGHMGNWELMGLAVAHRWSPVNAVVRPQHNRAFDAYWRASRERMGVRLLPHLHAFRDCLKALGRNEPVAIIIDQNMRKHRGIFVEFFGRPACTTPGLAYLAAQSQAPVVPAYMVRGPDGRHTLHMLPPLAPPADRRPETIHATTQAYTRIWEDIVRRHPDQWIWLHKRWRTQP